MSLKFSGKEKLKSKKKIERLFSEGSAVSKFPLKMIYLPEKDLQNSVAAFAVPKRSFKLAVSRNRIKRQMKEAFRLNKAILSTNKEANYAFLFLYIGKHNTAFETIESAMVALLKNLQK